MKKSLDRFLIAQQNYYHDPPGAGRNFDVDLYSIIRDSYDKIKKVLYDF